MFYIEGKENCLIENILPTFIPTFTWLITKNLCFLLLFLLVWKQDTIQILMYTLIHSLDLQSTKSKRKCNHIIWLILFSLCLSSLCSQRIEIKNAAAWYPVARRVHGFYLSHWKWVSGFRCEKEWFTLLSQSSCPTHGTIVSEIWLEVSFFFLLSFQPETQKGQGIKAKWWTMLQFLNTQIWKSHGCFYYLTLFVMVVRHKKMLTGFHFSPLTG